MLDQLYNNQSCYVLIHLGHPYLDVLGLHGMIQHHDSLAEYMLANQNRHPENVNRVD